MASPSSFYNTISSPGQFNTLMTGLNLNNDQSLSTSADNSGNGYMGMPANGALGNINTATTTTTATGSGWGGMASNGAFNNAYYIGLQNMVNSLTNPACWFSSCDQTGIGGTVVSGQPSLSATLAANPTVQSITGTYSALTNALPKAANNINWLFQMTLIPNVPNWVVIAGGVGVVMLLPSIIGIGEKI